MMHIAKKGNKTKKRKVYDTSALAAIGTTTTKTTSELQSL
jgi:hypothetical protein